MRCIFWWERVRPRYTITKIKKIFLGRFFKIFLIMYSRIHHAYLVGWRQRKLSFSNGTCCAVDILVHPPTSTLSKTKTTHSGGLCFWWSCKLVRFFTYKIQGFTGKSFVARTKFLHKPPTFQHLMPQNQNYNREFILNISDF